MSRTRNKKPFCTAPWHSISLAPNGEIGPCCIIPFGFGNITKGETLDSAWNGEPIRKFRRSILNGNVPEGCTQCLGKDKIGVKSTMSIYNEFFQGRRQTDEPYTEEGFYDQFFHLDLSLSNKCNLKCRFCHPGYSTSWFKDRDAMLARNPKHKLTLGSVRDAVDVAPEEILPFLEKLTHVRQIEFKGGEPFMSRGHVPMLKQLIESGRAKDLELQYTSNGTMIDEGVFDLFKEFRRISFSVSVDGLDSVYRYIRGGKFSFEDHVVPSLAKISQRKMQNLGMSLHFTICAYNLLELSKFLDWHQLSGLNANISFGLVESPALLSAKILPPDLIAEAIRRLSKFKDPQTKELVTGLKNQEIRNMSLLRKDFYEFTTHLDQTRNTSIVTEIPDLADFYRSLEREFGVTEAPQPLRQAEPQLQI